MEGLGLFLAMVWGIWFLPPIVLFIVAFARRKQNRQAAKLCAIGGFVWLIIGGGICASLLVG